MWYSSIHQIRNIEQEEASMSNKVPNLYQQNIKNNKACICPIDASPLLFSAAAAHVAAAL